MNLHDFPLFGVPRASIAACTSGFQFFEVKPRKVLGPVLKSKKHRGKRKRQTVRVMAPTGWSCLVDKGTCIVAGSSIYLHTEDYARVMSELPKWPDLLQALSAARVVDANDPYVQGYPRYELWGPRWGFAHLRPEAGKSIVGLSV